MSRFKVKSGAEDIQSLPLGDIIGSIGCGMARAQRKLDEGSLIRMTKYFTLAMEQKNDLSAARPSPSWYTFSEMTAELKVVLTADLEESCQSALRENLSRRKKNPLKLRAVTMNGVVANKYGCSIETCAELKFEIKPLPAAEVKEE